MFLDRSENHKKMEIYHILQELGNSDFFILTIVCYLVLKCHDNFSRKIIIKSGW